jgi:hypothetical protein
MSGLGATADIGRRYGLDGSVAFDPKQTRGGVFARVVRGTVKRCNSATGFAAVFVHISAIEHAGLSRFSRGQVVDYGRH